MTKLTFSSGCSAVLRHDYWNGACPKMMRQIVSQTPIEIVMKDGDPFVDILI